MKQQQIIKSVRKTWGFCPVSRVKQSKTKYNRKPKHRGKYD